MTRELLPSLIALALVAPVAHAANWTEGMKQGKAEFKSMGPLAFGPEGILFVADTRAASIVAIDTGDTKPAGVTKPLKIESVNQKIAGLLGTAADQVLIDDMAVNPVSRSAYLAVSRGRGPSAVPVLIRANASGELELVSLDAVKFSRAQLPDAPADAPPAEGSRRSNPRQESITDIAFLENRVLIAGLSNEEFASTLRAVPFPFQTVGNGTSVEIYHGAHGKFETRSPIRTFVPYKVGDQPSLLAAYTCTPLVQFPLSEIKPGAKIKGKTVAELGNRNRPIDMIVYQKEGKDYLLLANSSRGIMKIDAAEISGAESITTRVEDKKGVGYQTIESLKGIEHLDRFDDKSAAVLRRGEGGAQTLESVPLP